MKPGSTSSILDVGLPGCRASRSPAGLRRRGNNPAHPDAHRAGYRGRPGERAQFGRRRLSRQALRLRRARRSAARPRPPEFETGTRRAEPKLSAGPITLDEAASLGHGRRPSRRASARASSPSSRRLLRHRGQALSRDQLLDQAWPFGVAVTPNAVDAYVHYLRGKLGHAGFSDRDRARSWIPPHRCLTGRPRLHPTAATLLTSAPWRPTPASSGAFAGGSSRGAAGRR